MRGGKEHAVSASRTFSSLIATIELSSLDASVTMRRFAARFPFISAAGPPPPAAGGALDRGREKLGEGIGLKVRFLSISY